MPTLAVLVIGKSLLVFCLLYLQQHVVRHLENDDNDATINIGLWLTTTLVMLLICHNVVVFNNPILESIGFLVIGFLLTILKHATKGDLHEYKRSELILNVLITAFLLVVFHLIMTWL